MFRNSYALVKSNACRTVIFAKRRCAGGNSLIQGGRCPWQNVFALTVSLLTGCRSTPTAARCSLCSFSCKPESLSLHHLTMLKHAIDSLYGGIYTTVNTGGSPFRILSVSVWVELSTYQCSWPAWTVSGLTCWVLKSIN